MIFLTALSIARRRISAGRRPDRSPVLGCVLLARLDRGFGLAGRLAFPCREFGLDLGADRIVFELQQQPYVPASKPLRSRP
jgi:hypothetical protein